MMRRVLIGVAIVLVIAATVLICTVLMQQKLPMEGTLV